METLTEHPQEHLQFRRKRKAEGLRRSSSIRRNGACRNSNRNSNLYLDQGHPQFDRNSFRTDCNSWHFRSFDLERCSTPDGKSLDMLLHLLEQESDFDDVVIGSEDDDEIVDEDDALVIIYENETVFGGGTIGCYDSFSDISDDGEEGESMSATDEIARQKEASALTAIDDDGNTSKLKEEQRHQSRFDAFRSKAKF